MLRVCTFCASVLTLRVVIFFVYTDNDRIQPQHIIAVKGSDIKITCDTPNSTHILWFYNHGTLSSNVDKEGNTLIISNVGKHNKGIYECVGIVDNKPYYSLFSATTSLFFSSKLF